MMLEELRLIDEQIDQLDQDMANLLSQHQDAVQRLAEVPGLGVNSAQQIIAELGATAGTFPSEKQLSSWVGACPGDNERAGVDYSHRSPKGNRHMRRILNQSANAAVKVKGSIFEIVYHPTLPRLGHQQTIGVVVHRQCRLIWKILHQGVRYEERGTVVNTKSRQKRTARMIRELRSLGYRVEPAPFSTGPQVQDESRDFRPWTTTFHGAPGNRVTQNLIETVCLIYCENRLLSYRNPITRYAMHGAVIESAVRVERAFDRY